jgi:hypothetical protein
VIEGDTGDKTAVVINSLEINCHTPNRVVVQHLAIKGYLIQWEGTLIEPRDLHFLNATSGSFSGGCGLWLQDAGCRAVCFGDWSIAQGATFQIVQWWAETFIQWSVTSVTALGSGCNVSPFMYACGTVFAGTQTTFTGTFTGIRWKIDENGFINLGGRTGGLTFWPGTIEGIIRDAGRYAYGRNTVVSKLVTEDHTTKTITLGAGVVARHTPMLFSALPASPAAGMVAAISDSTTDTWGATAAGGGSLYALVSYNGTAWKVIGK